VRLYNYNIDNCTPIPASRATQLFITNGGAHSVMEAAIYGVPMLGIPIHSPNYNTMHKLVAHGMARILDRNNITAFNLYENIYNLLHDPK
jgi:UDP:flavonoid glycosyltransferase YjiC (YdhE family)